MTSCCDETKIGIMESTIVEQDMEEIYQNNLEWKQLKDKAVMLTGATGMLGSYLLFFLIYLNKKYSMNIRISVLVRNKDKLRACIGENLDEEFLQVYTFDINRPWPYMGSVDYVIHAASLASPQYYSVCPVEVAEPNVIGTYYLLQAAREMHVKKVLFFSSGDIYGLMPQGTGAINENMQGTMDPLDEHSCYGEAKRMGEAWCAAFAREYQVPVTIARIGHTYGPTMDIKNDPRVFSSFMKCIYEGQNIVMHSDGSAKRPFCYITDATVAFFILLFKGKAGEAYNVCNTKNFISILELANNMVHLRKDLNLKIIQTRRDKDDAYLDNQYNCANCPVEDKIVNLGWNCKIDVCTGFSRVYDYLTESQI